MNEDELARLKEWIAEHCEEAMMADGLEDAIIGIAERCSCPSLVVYDFERCVGILMERDGMTEEDAVEFLEFNTVGAWVGPRTPLFLRRPPRS